MTSTAVAISTPSNHGFNAAADQSLSSRKVSINVKSERITTVISAGTQMAGDLLLKEGIKLDGDMRGTLTFGTEDGLCVIAKSGTLQGDLYGPRALIMGAVEGDVHISGMLMLAPGAMIMGNVYYGRLIVHDGAQISGTMNMNNARALAAPAHTSMHEMEGGATRDDMTQGVVRPLRAAAS